MSTKFVTDVKDLLEETFAAIASAKMSEDFLQSAGKAFHEIPNFIDAFKAQESNVDPSDPS